MKKTMQFAGIGAMVVVFGVVSAVDGAITLVGPNNPVLFVNDDCPGPCVCATFSNPIAQIAAPAGPTSDLGKAMTAAYPGWQVTYGGAVNGTITVDKYRPYVCEYRTPSGSFKKDVHCMHGVELSMRFTPAAGEAPPSGQTAQWVQYVDTFDFSFAGNGCGRQFTKNDKFIDASSTNPPYYPGSAQSFYDSPQDGCYNYLDACGQIEDFCPRPCWWGGHFQTYLAYGTAGGAMGQVRMMDGVAWNFQATCVARPTPVPPPTAGTPVPGPGVPVTVVPGGGGTPNPGGIGFGDATVELLNLDGSDVTDPAYAGDAMLGATISVTDFTFLAGGDGHYIFEGGHLSIHKDGIVFLEAELPILVVNDEWAADTGSNICAQYGEVQYNLGAGSDYIAAIADFDALPQTFGAFRACTALPLEPLLASGAGGVLDGSIAASFCLVPEPATLVLLLGGLTLTRRRRR